ncbi:hypothetical protein HU200_058461 [Digitaria exilis]|uniref:KIB1-4 beta-propeller domain-containing protein n=1 Tax=Digitaria exilis TaxID=1010633 RepID=A0A835ADE0_9POAL|nr:hypothetical protein HU200_058461 [Digitaria exilis]CAB3492852.1 unnamed protein product [Digitaria exilis]
MAEATQRGGPPPSWSDIPWDLAGRVLRLLPAYVDRVRFAAVCPQWRAAARQLLLPPPLPVLAVPDGTFYSVPYDKPFRFPGFGCADFKDAVCDRWLVFPRDDGCFLVDHFAGERVKLPCLSQVRLRPSNAASNPDIGSPYITWMSMLKETKRSLTFKKMVLCSPNLVAATVGDGSICQILMCHPGGSSWSVRAYDACMQYADMTFYQGKLYALHGGAEILFVVNISQGPRTGDPHVARIGQVINGDPDPSIRAWLPNTTMHMKKLYLVESCGALLMIRRKIFCRLVGAMVVSGQTIELQVLEADWEHSRWVKVATLGDDLMLFLGRSCSKVVRASQYGMSGDQIFFLDDVFENDEYSKYIIQGNTSVSVYDMRTGEISSPLPMV